MAKQRAESSHAERRFLYKWWRVLALFVLLCGLGGGGWRAFFFSEPEQVGLRLLNQAFHTGRPLESRITGLAYAPFQITRGGGTKDQDAVTLEEAGLLLHKSAREAPSAFTRHALAKLYLASHKFALAIEQFEVILPSESYNASLHCDLGTTLLELSRSHQQKGELRLGAYELARGLNHLNQAIALNDTLLEAHFNRALCREMMNLDDEAASGWRGYLEKDPNSLWAEEARLHLRQLEDEQKQTNSLHNSLVERFYSAFDAADPNQGWATFKTARARTGNVIVGRLIEAHLTTLAEAKVADQKLALRRLAWAGKLEAQQVGDHFTADLARCYAMLEQPQVSAVQQARTLLKQAAAVYDRQNLNEALALFAQAREAFRNLGHTAEAAFAEGWMGYCHNRLGQPGRSLAIFDGLRRFYRERRYKQLLAYTQHATADAYTWNDDWSAALDQAKEALQTAKEIEDELCQFRCGSALASINETLGKNDEALAAGWQNLALIKHLAVDPKQIWGAYSNLAVALLKLGLPFTALDVQQEVHRLAQRSNWPGYKSQSFSQLALIYNKLGKQDQALRCAELALAESDRLADSEMAAIQSSNAFFCQGQIQRAVGDNRQALRSFEQSLERSAQGSLQLINYEAHAGSFLASLAIRDNARAARELDAADKLLDQFRGQILEESTKIAFFDMQQEFYDAAIDFQFSRQNNPVKALELAEAYRARSLLEAKSSAVQVLKNAGEVELRLPNQYKPLDPNQIRARLPAQAQIVLYAMLSDKLVAWVINREVVVHVVTPLPRIALEAKIAHFLALLSTSPASSDQVMEAARELHRLVIEPVLPYLDARQQVCLVPDKALHTLPFVALLSPKTNRYFIADYTPVVAPSATYFILCTEMARHKSRASEERLLSIGNPRFASQNFPGLPDLPKANEEAKQVARLYSRSSLLQGSEADEAAVTAAMLKADVIHFAGHALANETDPLLSSLLLAPTLGKDQTEAGDGSLHSYELYQLGFLRARLVVLSACRTGTGRLWQTEGVMSLTRPFFSAGVPTVVASLWNIPEAAATELMIKFHHYRRQPGLTAAQALRAAQLDTLQAQPVRGKDFTWAAFSVIGSSLYN